MADINKQAWKFKPGHLRQKCFGSHKLSSILRITNKLNTDDCKSLVVDKSVPDQKTEAQCAGAGELSWQSLGLSEVETLGLNPDSAELVVVFDQI